MVYAKFIERNGERFGPYYYTSIRKNGKVVTIYLGKSPNGFKEKLLKLVKKSK